MVVRLAEENRSWGDRRLQGTLAHLGYQVARSTIAGILKRHGREPAPERNRKTTWQEFLTRHWELIVAADFFTIEVWTPKGLQRFIILFFIELSTRKVEIAGIDSTANGLWMNQIGRKVTDVVDGILNGKRSLIHDRDPLFTTEFLNLLAGVGVESVQLPPRSPNLNVNAERFVRTIQESCLDRLILFGENSLRKAVSEFVTYYHTERPHQGLQNQLIHPAAGHGRNTGRIQQRQRLVGLLNYYYRVPQPEFVNCKYSGHTRSQHGPTNTTWACRQTRSENNGANALNRTLNKDGRKNNQDPLSGLSPN